MEIFNLLFILFVYYLFYFLEFYQKVLLVFSSCVFVSLLVNHKTIEDKSNNTDSNKFLYFILNNLINIIIFIYNLTFMFLNNLKNVYGFSYIYKLLEKVNRCYLHGRDTIISYVLQNSMSLLFNSKLGQLANPSTQPANQYTQPVDNKYTQPVANQPLQNNSSTVEKKAFNNEIEMNNFLDDILNNTNKKNN